MSERSVEHGTIVIERRYPASPERTFAAWADAAAKARWLGVPDGELELDFRVGGEESHNGTLPDCRVYTYQGSSKTSSRHGGFSTPTRCCWTTAGSPSPWPRLSSRRSTTAPGSSTPNRAPSSTATSRPPAATRAWAAVGRAGQGAAKASSRAGSTALVPTASSYASRAFAGADDQDVGDAEGRIDAVRLSAGGRKVAGSNPVAPITGPERIAPHTALQHRLRGTPSLRLIRND
jgi:hypothetical protein